jgi:hypothetical protein
MLVGGLFCSSGEQDALDRSLPAGHSERDIARIQRWRRKGGNSAARL